MTTITVHARKFSSMLGIAKPEMDDEEKAENERALAPRERYNVQPPSPHAVRVKESARCVIL